MRPFALFLLLLSLASAAGAGTFPITSFEPDSTGRAPRDTVDRPVWIGVQGSPVVGGSMSTDPSDPKWDASGTPWVGLSAAWPWASPQEIWLAVGHERWEYALHAESIPFGNLLIPYISPLKVDQYMARTGIDWLIGRDLPVHMALGGGVGLGYGVGRIGQLPGSDWTVLGELLAHATTTVRLGARTRVGAGITGGPTFDFRDGASSVLHWELELRLEQAVGGR